MLEAWHEQQAQPTYHSLSFDELMEIGKDSKSKARKHVEEVKTEKNLSDTISRKS
jgi:hypothetical protein